MRNLSNVDLEFLADRGFDCYGVDISASAVVITEKRLAQKGLKAELRHIKENKYPFEDNFFDTVFGWNVFAYNDGQSLNEALSEAHRVLKPGGPLFATLPTFQDFCVSHGKKIGHNTFELIQDKSRQKGAISIAAENEEDLKSLFSSFKDLEIGHSEISVKGITNSRWIIYGKKM